MIGAFLVSSSRSRQARWSRLSSYVLLFLISFSSSIEIFHRHGFVDKKTTDAYVSAGICSDESDNDSSEELLESGCLVCQFQRSLSSAAMVAPLLIWAPTDIEHRASSEPITQDSLSATASHGRAPPVTL
jgi:hypothetical protein